MSERLKLMALFRFAGLTSIPPDPDTISIREVADVEASHEQALTGGHGHSHDPHFDPESHSTVSLLFIPSC